MAGLPSARLGLRASSVAAAPGLGCISLPRPPTARRPVPRGEWTPVRPEQPLKQPGLWGTRPTRMGHVRRDFDLEVSFSYVLPFLIRLNHPLIPTGLAQARDTEQQLLWLI